MFTYAAILTRSQIISTFTHFHRTLLPNPVLVTSLYSLYFSQCNMTYIPDIIQTVQSILCLITFYALSTLKAQNRVLTQPKVIRSILLYE